MGIKGFPHLKHWELFSHPTHHIRGHTFSTIILSSEGETFCTKSKWSLSIIISWFALDQVQNLHVQAPPCALFSLCLWLHTLTLLAVLNLLCFFFFSKRVGVIFSSERLPRQCVFCCFATIPLVFSKILQLQP